MIDMKPMQLEGRAVLCFPHDGDAREPQVAAATQRREMDFTSRGNILKHWLDFPLFIRKDESFQCLMDYYHPMTDDEYEVKKAINRELIAQHAKDAFGGRAARLVDERLYTPQRTVEMNGQRWTYTACPELDEEEVIRLIKSIPLHRAAVDFNGPFGGGTAISTTSTAKTVIGVKPRSNQSAYMWGYAVGFDGTTSTNGPAIIELHQNTFATNAPGTNSTSVTVYPIDNGRPETLQSSVGKAWTTEPTVLTLWENFFIPSYMGSGIVFQPLTKPFILTGTIGGSMRVTQQSGVTANGTGALKCQE